MDVHFFLPLLAMFTLLAAVVFAMRGAKKVEERRHDPSKPASSLAPDGDSDRKVD